MEYREFRRLQEQYQNCSYHGQPYRRFKNEYNYSYPELCTCSGCDPEYIFEQLNREARKAPVGQEDLSMLRNEAADRFKKMIGLSIVNAFLTLGFGVERRERGPVAEDDSTKRFQLLDL